MKETLHIYTRVSTDQQVVDGFGLENQRQVGLKLSEKLGFEPVVHNEGSKSSHNDDITTRPVLSQIMDQIEQGKIKNLYVFNTDRLSRNQQVWNFIRLKLTSNKVTLYVSEGTKYQLDDPMDDFILGIMSEVSRYDNSLRTNRLRLGKLSHVKTGGWKGGPPPFGYKLVDGQLVPETKEKRWVKNIYEDYANGKSIYNIRKRLMSNGIISRRGNFLWSDQSIKKILLNTHYEGYWFYNDRDKDHKDVILETVRVECPRILSSKLVKTVRDRLNNLKQTGNRTKTVTLLRGYLFCSHCGSQHGTRINPKQSHKNYYCRGNEIQKSKNPLSTEKLCKIENGRVRSLDIDSTDNLVWETILDVIGNSILFKENFKKDLLKKGSFELSTQEIKKLKIQIKNIEKKIKEAIEGKNSLVVAGIIDKSALKPILLKFEDETRKLRAQKEELLDKIEMKDRNRKWVDWVKEFGDQIDDLKKSDTTMDKKRRFLEGVLDKIFVETTSKQTHQLHIRFTNRYVDDKIKFNSNKKSDGYKIVKGKNETAITFESVDRRKKKQTM